MCSPYNVGVCLLFSCPTTKASDHADHFKHLLWEEKSLGISFLLPQQGQNFVVCLPVHTVVLICTILNAFQFSELFLYWHTLASTAPMHWSQSYQPVTENSKKHFLDLILMWKLPVLMSSKSTFPMWLLYTDTIFGHVISTCSFFLPIKSPHLWLGNSSINVEMRAPLLLYLNITGATLTESNFVAYSREKPRGFLLKSCSVENLQFGSKFCCTVPIHRILFEQIHQKWQWCVPSIKIQYVILTSWYLSC